ncbi:MAG TPA: hypothetical protein VEJ19_08755 [Nitrososphaerales archaeon]|nr:hypothetical protein [Nitrososphaerales archaeon]
MRRRTKAAIGIVIAVVVVFFFFVPVVSTLVDPCIVGGFGYASLSFYLLSFGATYMGGQYVFLTSSMTAVCF